MTKSADAFRTISEVADWLGIPAHVLRFWESKFTQVKPVKRAGGRRYYRPADMRLLGGIRKLLHEDGMTIKGVQKVMRDHGVRHVAAMSPPLADELEEEIADIALDVPQEDEKRGQVLSFGRTGSATPDGDAGAAKAEKPASSGPGQPSPATPSDLGQERAAEPKSEKVQARSAAEKADLSRKDAPEAVDAERAMPEQPDTAPILRAVSITLPEDAADTMPAAASPLAGLGRLNLSLRADQLADLTDLLRRMESLRKRMSGESGPS
ncbi:MAG: MerR family transcriptional regulator [Rhodobacterales bacterium]|nr:MerR family transcriptional regulator [Rhodobacterales bacterium]